MEAVSIRVLPFATASGAENMARDEALLESAAGGVASLRFYGWSEPTVSLGYFQHAEVRTRAPALAGLPFVRRPSGGATLVHDRELTYALALPPGPPWQPPEERPHAWLARMHGVVADALHSLGVATRLAGMEARSHGGSILCFQQPVPGDLLIGAAKVAGSAQRRLRGALMQHGGILLDRSVYAPVLPGIRELAHRDIPPAELVGAIMGALLTRTGWNLLHGEWTHAENARTAELVTGRYARSTWNEKR